MLKSEQQLSELSEKDKQDRILEARSNIASLKHDFLNRDSSIARMWRTDHKDVIRYWAEQEEVIHNFTGQPLVTIANKITKELQALKLVDNDYTYVYDVLPAKYKSHSPNPVIDYSDEPSKTGTYKQKKELREQNIEIINRLRKSAEIMDNMATDLETIPLIENMDAPARQQLPAWLNEWDGVNESAEEYRDKRQSVAAGDYALFAQCFAIFGISGCASKYYSYARVEIDKITQKQTHKIANGLISKVPAVYEPRNVVEAIKRKWYGIRCDKPDCGKWRVLEVSMLDPVSGERKYNLKCFACNNTMPVVSKPFPGQLKKEQELHTDSSGNTFTVEVDKS